MLIGLCLLFALGLSLSLGLWGQYPFPEIFPSGFSLAGLGELFGNALFQSSLRSSIVLGISTALCATVLGFLLARGMSKYCGVYKLPLMAFFTMPLFFPAISMFIGVHSVMLKLGMANTFFGVLIAHTLISLPYAMNIGLSFYEGIDPRLEQVSALLGGTGLCTLRRVLLPLIASGLRLSFRLAFLCSMSEYFATFLIGGGNVLSISGILYPYIAQFDMQQTALLMGVFLGINLVVFGLSSLGVKHIKP